MKPMDSLPSFHKNPSGIYLFQTQMQLRYDLGFPTAHILGEKKTQTLLSPAQ